MKSLSNIDIGVGSFNFKAKIIFALKENIVDLCKQLNRKAESRDSTFLTTILLY